MRPKSHIYVHVPFCVKKCSYCGFYSVPYEPPAVQRYISALEVELRQRLSSAARPRTIHVGGGTPTALSDSELAQLLRLIDMYADMSELEEYAVEANPGTLTDNKIAVLKDAGVDRISLGVQSFDDAKLQLLGRLHGGNEAKKAFSRLAAAGFDNLGLDLIYGVPGDTQSSWLADLGQATALEPKHISAYCLSVEPGTALAGQLKRGELAQPEEQLQRELYYRCVDSLVERGFEHYEISNFARPGFRSMHNSATWRYEPYMGFGPAAASFDGAIRRRNPADLEKYCASPEEPAEMEEPGRMQRAAEVMMLALRTLDGISAAQFQARCGLDIAETFGERISELESRGLLERAPGTDALRLTHDALFVSDEVLVEFF